MLFTKKGNHSEASQDMNNKMINTHIHKGRNDLSPLIDENRKIPKSTYRRGQKNN